MKKRNIYTTIVLGLLATLAGFAQTDTITHELVIKQEKITIAGKERMGMTINGSIPGPTIRFTEGDYAVIYVRNEMDVETSVHWHGLLLPNFYDGVPYLTTPPIKPGNTQKYEFLIRQSGTYWYHSHTMLQEQSGVYGSFVIDPKDKTLDYNKELVLVLSDWTHEKPAHVLKNLKRGTEWYNFRKGTATPLNRVIGRGAFGAQLNFWKQRMEGADIADIYYAAFLTNGAQIKEYPEFKPGDNIRLRIINAAASTSFWMTFGGETPLLVSADGLDVVPVRHNKTFIAVAETYDFIIHIPQQGKVEFRAMAQDGSGTTSAFFGKGEVLAAPVVPRPDKIGMMQQMAKMKMRMGAPALKFNPGKDKPYEMKKKWGMQMDMEGMSGMDHSSMNHTDKDSSQMNHEKEPVMPEMNMAADSMKQEEMKKHQGHDKMAMDQDSNTGTQETPMDGMNMFSAYTYDDLKSPEPTSYDSDAPVKEILLNLTGNMARYIWSMNGIPLSETDKITIREGEITRITFNNLTMMHHPMHLHGHFFRVINQHGEYSPLKHTVNVPPMQQVTIEFYGNEYGDWFFHCHILYHMMGGMARIFSYDTPRDERLQGYPVSHIVEETNLYYSWGMADIASHMTEVNLVAADIRNQFNLGVEFGYNQNVEAEVSYERYLYDYLRVFVGVNVENGTPQSLTDLEPTVVAGVRLFTPYMFGLDLRVDHLLRPRVGIGRSFMIFPRFSIFGYYEYQADFGWVKPLPDNATFAGETVWNAGAELMLSRDFSLMGSYDNRFGAGGGLSVRF